MLMIQEAKGCRCSGTMSGNLFVFAMTLLVLRFMIVRAQSDTQGFISIDCGLPKDKGYNDTRGLPYISDSEFTDTGESHYGNSISIDPPYKYLRSFPNGTRNCYKIKPVIQGTKYLVRARFLYWNYDELNNPPQFDLYLGINYWDTVTIHSTEDDTFAETMVVTVSNSLSICLVNTNQGIPYISAIELRPLPEELYLEANTFQSLVLLGRVNIGGHESFRYPEDIFDRFWTSDTSTGNMTLNTSLSILTSFFTEPPGVMQSLIHGDEGNDLAFEEPVVSLGACPSTRAYFIFYFAELEKLLQNESRIFHVLDNAIISDEIQPEYLKTTTFQKSVSFSGYLKLFIEKVPRSTKPPILNAFEAYRIINMTCQFETSSLDVDAMVDIKSFYKVQRNWNGDPCAPMAYMWEGLNCSYDESSGFFITSLNLSSSGLTGGIPVSLANLSALQYLDLSNNSLTGEVPESFSNLTQLKYLRVAHNNLTGSIPTALLQQARNGYLNLSAEGNPFLCSNPDSCLKDSEKNSTDGNPNMCSKPDSCQEESSKKNNKVLAIVVVSCILAAVLLLALVSVVVWRYKRRQSTVEVPSSSVQGKLRLSPVHLDSTQFTYSKIIKITDNFTRQIGRGGFGPVYHGTSDLGVQVAVKMLSHSSSQGVKEFKTEAKLLTRIHHRNLVALIGFCDDDIDHLALIYEYMEGGNLQDNLSGKSRSTSLSWRDRLRIAFEAAQGLEYLHKGCRPSIVHRDVKTSNILLTKNLEARIADFGLSRLFEDDGISTVSTRIVGTPGYVDPEYNITNQLNERSDVYSFGIVLMELIIGLPAIIKREETIHITQWIQQRLTRGEIEEIVDKSVKEDYDVNSAWKVVETARSCTAEESHQRPSMSEVVMHLKDCLEISMACEKKPTSVEDNQDSGCFTSNEAIPQHHPSMINSEAR